MAKKKTKNVTIRFEDEIHKPARVRIAELDSSFQDVVIVLMTGWVKAGCPWPPEEEIPSGPFPYRKANKIRHDQLEDILVLGSPEDARGIGVNLDNFVEAIRSRPLRRSSKRVVGE